MSHLVGSSCSALHEIWAVRKSVSSTVKRQSATESPVSPFAQHRALRGALLCNAGPTLRGWHAAGRCFAARWHRRPVPGSTIRTRRHPHSLGRREPHHRCSLPSAASHSPHAATFMPVAVAARRYSSTWGPVALLQYADAALRRRGARRRFCSRPAPSRPLPRRPSPRNPPRSGRALRRTRPEAARAVRGARRAPVPWWGCR